MKRIRQRSDLELLAARSPGLAAEVSCFCFAKSHTSQKSARPWPGSTFAIWDSTSTFTVRRWSPTTHSSMATRVVELGGPLLRLRTRHLQLDIRQQRSHHES